MRGIGRKVVALLLTLAICVGMVDRRVFAEGIGNPVRGQIEEAGDGEPSEADMLAESTVLSETDASSDDGSDGQEAQGDWDGVTSQSVYEGQFYKVTFFLTAHWDGGYRGNIKIDNTGDSVIKNWYIGFDWDNTISDIYSATIHSYESGSYVIANAGWNREIAVGGSVEFGFGGEESFRGFPASYTLLGDNLEVNEGEYAVAYRLEDDWGSGFRATLSVTNNGDKPMEDWTLAFDFERRITSIWNAIIISEEESADGGYRYGIRNAGYNGTIVAGETVSFGFLGEGGQKTDIPKNFVVCQYGLGGAKAPERNEDEVIVRNACYRLDIGYAFGDTADAVTSDLDLCTRLDGAVIEWRSSHPNIVGSDGVVNRPAGRSEAVTLTAGISCKEAYEEKTFEIYVIKNTYENYNTDYIEDMDSLELLYRYNGGDPENLEVYLNKEDKIAFIKGSFSGFVVESPEEAVLALYEVKSLMGAEDPKEELRWASTTKDAYGTAFRFEQIYQGIPIYGKSIVVATDNDGNTSSLQSSFTGGIDLDVEPKLSAADVKAVLEENGFTVSGDGELYIYVEEGEPKLAWNMEAVDDEGICNILTDAREGRILFRNALMTSEGVEIEKEATGISWLKTEETFRVVYQETDSTELPEYYRLRDARRNISIFDALGETTSTIEKNKGIPLISETNTWGSGEVSAITNVSKAYDFYYNHFGRKGADGKNSVMEVSINFHVADSFSSGVSRLLFGQGGDYIYGAEAALDTVGHEYTHCVFNGITGLRSGYVNRMIDVIKEGYADIFGYFIEGDDDPEWLHREDNMKGARAKRNMSNPAECKTSSKIGDKFYVNNGGTHENSTIISHACYLMWKNGISNKDRLVDLWYHSILLGYDVDSTFHSVRVNVLTAAENMRMSGDEVQIIKAAFDEVGIEAERKADLEGTNILTGKIVIADTNFLSVNNTALSGATVTLSRVEGIRSQKVVLYRKTGTRSDGVFYIMNIIPGTYELTVSKDGYLTATQRMVLSDTQINNYCSTIELIPAGYDGTGTAAGKITDTMNGQNVEGLTLLFRSGMNTKEGEVVYTTSTLWDGMYMATGLKAGHYCIEVRDDRLLKEGQERYIRTYLNVKVMSRIAVVNQNTTVCTSASNKQVRILLEWAKEPRHLKANLLGPTSDGKTFCVNNGITEYTESGVNIAKYELSGVGAAVPEIITLNHPVDGVYTYYVNNLLSAAGLSTSRASVKVYFGADSEPAYTFHVPVDGKGSCWTVFSYDSQTRKIHPINIIGDEVEQGGQ